MSITRIVGLMEIVLICVILPFSLVSLWIAFNNISYINSLFPVPLNSLLHQNYQSILFGLLGIITFFIGLIGVIKLRKKEILFSNICFSLVIIWSSWTVIVAFLSLREYSALSLEFTVSWEGIIWGSIMIISSAISLVLLSKY